MKQISVIGEEALVVFEGLRYTAYRDVANVWTIGVGHTAAAGPPTPVKGMTISREQAFDILARDLDVFEAAVNKRLPNVPQHVFDGAVSFCYNVGTGAFRKASWPTKYLAGNFPSAEAALRQWNKAKVNGRLVVVQGLVNRRAQEADIIFRGRYPKTVSTARAPVIDGPPDPKPALPPADNPPPPASVAPVGGAGASAFLVGVLTGNWWIIAAAVIIGAIGVAIYLMRKG